MLSAANTCYICSPSSYTRNGHPTIGGSKGVPGTPPPRGPHSFIFLQFSAKNLQNNRLAHPLWELAHTKSWNRHCQRWYHTCGTFVTTTLQPTPHSLLQLSPLHNNTQPTIYIPLHTTHTQCEGDRQLSESVRVTHITAVWQIYQPGNYVKIRWNLKF